MTLFLLCMLPIAATLGFFACAMLQVASAADRQDEAYCAQRDDNEHQEECG